MKHWCARCKTVRPQQAFHRNRTRGTGQASWCKTCVRAYQAERYARAHGYRWIPLTQRPGAPWRPREEP